MKKLVIAVMFIAVMLVASGSWAYTTSLTSILVDSPGQVQMFVGVWAPGEAGSPYANNGYWYYEYSINNLSYSPLVTNFDVSLEQGLNLELVSTPSGWSWYPTVLSYGWANNNGLSVGSSASGFVVRSTSPFTGLVAADAWTPTKERAYGYTLGPVTPEPATAMLLGFGLIGLVGAARKKFMS